MKTSRRLRFGESRHSFGVYRRPVGPVVGAPTVVLVHGGSWRWPYNRWVMLLLQRDLARRGWGSFNIEYRRLGRYGGGGGWPHTFDDVRDGIELMTSGQGPTGVDPSKIAVVGHSAGGHLALVAAAQLAAGSGVAPAVVVSMAGPTDLEKLWQNGSQPVEALTLDAPVGARWSLTSPVHMLPFGLPIHCVHGSADTTVSSQSSIRFGAAAVDAGDDCTVVIVPEETHRDALRPRSAMWSAVVAAISLRLVRDTQV